MADGTRRTDIWITKSLPELSSGETKMTIFIISSSQKTRGQVTGNPVRLHATRIARPSRRAWHRAWHRTLYSVAHIYLRAACLLRCICTKKRTLNYFENVNKDQNCDRLNFIFVHFSLENEDVYIVFDIV